MHKTAGYGNKKLILFLLTSILLISTSCRNVFYQAQLDSIDVAEEELQEEKEEKKFYTVTGTVGINLPENNARTAMPAVDLTSPSFSSLSYTVEAENQSDSSKVTGEITISATEVKYKIYLSDGTWKLNIKAYTDAAHTNQVFAGSTVFTIESLALSSGSTSVNLTGVSSGTGTVTLPVKIAADSGITSGKAVWTVGGVDKEETLTFDIANSVFEDSFNLDDGSSNAPAGTYTVRFIFYKGPTVAYSFVETVNVFNGLETNKWLNSTSAVYLTGNSVLITKALVQSYALKTFYVDPVNGSDSESGDFFFPVSSVQRAVNMIDAVNDGVSEYNIILNGDFTATSSSEFTSITNVGPSLITITPASALKLTIKSNSATKKTISAENLGRVIYVGPKSDVTLENLIITKGNFAVYNSIELNSSGAGVLVDGISTGISVCTITNCEITQNGIPVGAGDSKVANGGGIVAIRSRLNIENSTISYNSAKWGGGIYYFYESEGSINKTKINNNNAISTGGGIWSYSCGCGNTSTYLVINECDIYSNSSGGGGGGMYNKGNARIKNSKLYLNNAVHGGAVCSNNRRVYFEEETQIYNNTASSGGGALANLAENGNSTFTLTNCSITDNTVQTGGKGSGILLLDNKSSLGYAAKLEISDDAILNPDQIIYLSSYPNDVAVKDSTTFNQKTIDFGTLTKTAAEQSFSVQLGDYVSGTKIISAPTSALTSEYAQRITIMDSTGAASTDYFVNSSGKLQFNGMALGGNLVHTLVLNNDITFAASTTTVSKATGGAITITSSINSNPVANVFSTYEGFKVEVLSYGVQTGVENDPGLAKVVIPSGCDWPAGKYELYITGKYQGVEYNASIYFDLTE